MKLCEKVVGGTKTTPQTTALVIIGHQWTIVQFNKTPNRCVYTQVNVLPIVTSRTSKTMKGMSWREKLRRDKTWVVSKMSNTILIRFRFKNILAPIRYLLLRCFVNIRVQQIWTPSFFNSLISNQLNKARKSLLARKSYGSYAHDIIPHYIDDYVCLHFRDLDL